MNEQKFHHGDWVRIADGLGPHMSHFRSGTEAIVVASYNDQYGGGNTKSYTLFIRGSGECSWYEECQLTLIESGRTDKLQEWKEERDREIKMRSDLDWIFSHGEEVLGNPHGATATALASCFGMTNLRGRRGEGFTFFQNASMTFLLAGPYLKNGDKEGWLSFCKELAPRIGRTAA